jgi:transcriptional regulator with XRE-family HTH domain
MAGSRAVAPDSRDLCGTIGKGLRERRIALDLDLAEVARRAALTETQYRRIEDGRVACGLDQFVRIAGALDGSTLASLTEGIGWTPRFRRVRPGRFESVDAERSRAEADALRHSYATRTFGGEAS